MKGFGKILNYCENPLWIIFFSLKSSHSQDVREKTRPKCQEKSGSFKIQRPHFLPPALYSEIARGSFLFQLPVGFSTLNELVEMKKILTIPASSIKSRSN